MVSGNLWYGSGNSNWGSVITQRGGEGWEVGGREVQDREGTHVHLCLIHVDVWQKATRYYEAIILQLKINFKN